MSIVSLAACNPYVRAGEIHNPMETETGLRRCYDYRLFCVMECRGDVNAVLLEDREVPLTDGSIIVLPARTAYDFRGNMRMGILNFDVTRAFESRTVPLCPPPLGQFREELVFDPSRAEGFEEPVIFRGGDTHVSCVYEIIRDFSKRNAFSDSSTSGRLKSLLSDIRAGTAESYDAETGLADSVMAYVRMNGTRLSCNDDIAGHFGYNKVYLGAVLRRKKGISLHKALNDVKTERAEYLLKNTADSVESISEKCGFSSRSYFCTVFLAKNGVTPLEYRKGK